MKKLVCIGAVALFGLGLAGCSTKTLTFASAGWQTVSINNQVVEKVSCDYDKGTLSAEGLINYAGQQKPLKFKNITVQCNNQDRQLETVIGAK